MLLPPDVLKFLSALTESFMYLLRRLFASEEQQSFDAGEHSIVRAAAQKPP